MCRDYGSRLYELVDAPTNRQTLVDIYAATAEAILRWEPRFFVTRVQVEAIEPGGVTLMLEGEYRPTGEVIQLEGLTL